jgi:gliding motility-associated lipoprotein GldH
MRDGERVIHSLFSVLLRTVFLVHSDYLRKFATEYPYRNLYLFIHENLLDSTVWRTDTIAVNLADSTGRWTGNGWGSIYQTAVFVKSVRPLHPGNYTVKIVHGMQDEKLTGLNDVGIRIEKQGE